MKDDRYKVLNGNVIDIDEDFGYMCYGNSKVLMERLYGSPHGKTVWKGFVWCFELL